MEIYRRSTKPQICASRSTFLDVQLPITTSGPRYALVRRLISGDSAQVRLVAYPELRRARMYRRTEDQLDIPTESEKHLQQSLDGKAFDFPREEQGHLRRRVANDPRRLGLIQVMVTNDRRDLLRQLFLRNEVLVASVT